MGRLERTESEIMKQLSVLIKDEVRDPRVAGCIVGITDVKVDSELEHATVSVSVYNGDGEQAVNGLNSSAGFLRARVMEKIKIRNMPAIKFVLDKGVAYTLEIEELLRKIKNND